MRLDGARLLIVGGAGLIGSHVVDELLRHDVKEGSSGKECLSKPWATF